jgi:Raf kinase inhibitor-like YbhB/YbcL family protein
MAVNIDKLAISSPDIAPLQRIGDDFSAAGGNKIPRLEAVGIPPRTVELSLILHDPDAPMPHGFTHWIVHGIPASEGRIAAEVARTGQNTMGKNSYVGPFPPPGHGTHHYYFWVYALDAHVTGTPSREEFLEKYAGNIIEQARFVATFSLE